MKRPGMKIANVKVTDADMVYFSLGLGTAEYVLPTERDDYRSDARAVALVADVRAGKDLSGRDFSGLNLKNADLSGGRFHGCTFAGAVFYKTNAKNADFSKADFTEAYLEGVDFSNADLSDADFKRVYARALRLDGARVDEDARRRFDALEVLIEKIESGEIDIRFLSRADLLGLDLRRLDLTHVDLDGLDLSAFVLEGVNLRGVYIDPKQLMSLEGLMHYYADVRAMQAKRLQTEAQQALRENQAKIKAYARMKSDERAADSVIYSNAADLTRPHLKPVVPPELEVQPPARPPATLQQAIETEMADRKKWLAQEKLAELRDRLAVRSAEQGARSDVSRTSGAAGAGRPVSETVSRNGEDKLTAAVIEQKNNADVFRLSQEEDKSARAHDKSQILAEPKDEKVGVLVSPVVVLDEKKRQNDISLAEVRAGFAAEPDMSADTGKQPIQSRKKTTVASDSADEDDVLEIKERPAVKEVKEVLKQAPDSLIREPKRTTEEVFQFNKPTDYAPEGIHQMAQKPRKITSQAYESADEADKEQGAESVGARAAGRLAPEVRRDARKKNRT